MEADPRFRGPRRVSCSGAPPAAAATTTGGPAQEGAVEDVSEQGDPVEGGEITVGLEAETNSWLPGEGTFSQPGHQRRLRHLRPADASGRRTASVQPYLAESMEPNEDLTDLDAEAPPGRAVPRRHPAERRGAQDHLRRLPQGRRRPTWPTLSPTSTSLDVVDDLTVDYILAAPNAAFPSCSTGAAGLAVLAHRGGAVRPGRRRQPGGHRARSRSSPGSGTATSWSRRTRTTGRRACPTWTGSPSGRSRTRTPACPACRAVTSTPCRPLRQSTVTRARDLDGVDNYEYLGNNTGGTIINSSIGRRSTTSGCARPWPTPSTSRPSSTSSAAPGSPRRPTQYFSPDSPFYSEAVAEAFPTVDLERRRSSTTSTSTTRSAPTASRSATDSPSPTTARPTRPSTSSPSSTSPSGARWAWTSTLEQK